METEKLTDIDLYELLGINCEAGEVEVRKAYRRKALECHPDKNPDNPRAAELFHQLSRALQLLTDVTARTAYDKVLRAKKASELRNKSLDSKRLKLKTDLEQRERDALNKLYAGEPFTNVRKTDEEILHDQIERLRHEGSKLLEEEQKLMREQLKKTMAESQKKIQNDSTQHRIKIKWDSHKNDLTNGGYSEKILLQYLKKYGDIIALAISKKPGSALVEFKSLEAAEMALAYEKGLLENPLKLQWLSAPKQKSSDHAASSSLDFEDLVLRKLRQAEERKRLVEQMQKEDELESLN